jgi:hypothetical protein
VNNPVRSLTEAWSVPRHGISSKRLLLRFWALLFVIVLVGFVAVTPGYAAGGAGGAGGDGAGGAGGAGGTPTSPNGGNGTSNGGGGGGGAAAVSA